MNIYDDTLVVDPDITGDDFDFEEDIDLDLEIEPSENIILTRADHHYDSIDGSSPIGRWAANKIKSNNPLAGIFQFKDNVNLMDAWGAVGGHRYNIVSRPAQALLGDNTVLNINDRNWLFPTWDDQEYILTRKDGKLKKSVSLVSDHFEIVQPSNAIENLYNYMVDQNNNPLPVTAIAATNDLKNIVIQWQTGMDSIKSDQINRYIAVKISMVGSIVGAFFDVRLFCLNLMPLLARNAQLFIPHRKGANDNFQSRFQDMMGAYQVALGLHSKMYDTLADIEMNEQDEKFIVANMYSYDIPPEAASTVSQNISIARAQQLVEEGRIPRSNLKTITNRVLAAQGIQKAVEDNNRRTLWEGCQANYAANHRSSKSFESYATQLAFEGGARRDEALKAFQASMSLAILKGYKNSFPKQMVDIVESKNLLSIMDYETLE